VNFALSLISGAAVTGLNVAGWAKVVANLGQPLGRLRMALLLAFMFLKLGFSALALYFILKAPWCSIPGLLVGLGLPALGLSLHRLFSLHRLPKD
jgi:hypothetical protein